jgi:hypothetical protein
VTVPLTNGFARTGYEVDQKQAVAHFSQPGHDPHVAEDILQEEQMRELRRRATWAIRDFEPAPMIPCKQGLMVCRNEYCALLRHL